MHTTGRGIQYVLVYLYDVNGFLGAAKSAQTGSVGI